MVRGQGNQVLSTRTPIEPDQRLWVPSLSLPKMADVFVSKLRWMAVVLHVILVLRLPLNVHVSRIPIALFGHALRTPMRPDSKLRITKPIWAAVGLQRLPERQEWTLWNLSAKKVGVAECPGNSGEPKRACNAQQECATIHNSVPPS